MKKKKIKHGRYHHNMKTCYYELLEVSSTATDTELKKAYRKQALLLHPDKNPDNVEESNLKFSLVRSAYEILSDPQERSWYDSHKNSILKDEDEDTYENGVSHLGSISADEIYRYFNPSMYTNFDNGSTGFYSIVSRLFERLAREEIQHGKYHKLPNYQNFKDDENNVYVISEEYLKYPLFGNGQSPYLDQVKKFYQVWSNFSTVKKFEWMDEYRYSTAQDRRSKRLMEKENKKIRDESRKEYNEVIKKFVTFIKKRDPRVSQGVEEVKRLEKLKKLQEIENAKSQKQKIKYDSFNEQNWQKLNPDEIEEFEKMIQEEYDESEQSTDSEFDDDSNDEAVEVHEYECVVCNKIMKNEQQFKIHEDSKKHKKQVRQLKWEMKKEGIDLGIDHESEDNLSDFETASSDFTGESDDESEKDERSRNSSSIHLNELELANRGKSRLENDFVDTNVNKEDKHSTNLVDNEIDEDEIERNDIENDLAELLSKTTIDDWEDKPKTKKSNKKKKQSKESTPSIAKETCTVCSLTFDSRNKLFDHVKREGHAALKSKSKKSKRK